MNWFLLQYKLATDPAFKKKYEAQHRNDFLPRRRRLLKYRTYIVGKVLLGVIYKIPGVKWFVDEHPALFSLSTKDLFNRWAKIFAALYLLVGFIYAFIKRGFHTFRKWLAGIINSVAQFLHIDFEIDLSTFGRLNFEVPKFPSYRKGQSVSAQALFNAVLGHEDAVVTSHWSKDRTVTLSDGTVQRRAHRGTDLRTRGHVNVYTPFDGVVTSVHNSLDGDGGRYIIVTSGSLCMFVCHLSKIDVKVGQKVSRGQKIAVSGRSGKGQENFYPHHLHVDFRKKVGNSWISVDPSSLATDIPVLLDSSISTPVANRPQHPVSRTPQHDSDVVNIAQYFINRGYSVNQAAAILGNLEQESCINPSALNTQSGASGICQWLGARKEAYRQKYGKYPHVDANLNHQIDYLYQEINEPWQKRLLTSHKFFESDDLDILTESFCTAFERPGKLEAQIAKRQGYALQCKNIYLSGAKTVIINNQSDSNTFKLHP